MASSAIKKTCKEKKVFVIFRITCAANKQKRLVNFYETGKVLIKLFLYYPIFLCQGERQTERESEWKIIYISKIHKENTKENQPCGVFIRDKDTCDFICDFLCDKEVNFFGLESINFQTFFMN